MRRDGDTVCVCVCVCVQDGGVVVGGVDQTAACWSHLVPLGSRYQVRPKPLPLIMAVGSVQLSQ